MKYAITSEDRVRIVPEGIADPADVEIVFSSAEELAAGVADWPLRRLVNVWNKLPTVTAVKRFENRSVAVGRIWRAIDSIRQQLEPPADSRIRVGKGELFVALLRHPEGATITALMSATGWQAHSVRGFISRELPKALVQSFRRDGERVYRVSEPPSGQAS